MRFIYITDFHGNHSAYKEAFQAAIDFKCQVIVNGGDILPKNFKSGTPFSKSQQEFFQSWLLPEAERLRQNGIRFYTQFGNDDAKGIVHLLDKADSLGTMIRLDERGWIRFGEYWILGMPWVPDYPFGLKDWVCGDLEPIPNLVQYSDPVITDQFHFVKLSGSWEDEIARRPTLKERLSKLPGSPDFSKSIFVMHSPPSHGGLDVISNGERVGSKAGLDYIAKHQPLLSLHGHIHESPRTTGQWYTSIGDTLAIQPGACPPKYVLIDLDARSVYHPIHGETKF